MALFYILVFISVISIVFISLKVLYGVSVFLNIDFSNYYCCQCIPSGSSFSWHVPTNILNQSVVREESFVNLVHEHIGNITARAGGKISR